MDAKDLVHGVDELFLNGLIGCSDGPGACQCEHDHRDEKLGRTVGKEMAVGCLLLKKFSPGNFLQIALFAMYYNFMRIYKTLRTTPAMAAKVPSGLGDR
jgi:hypothetical protein